MAQLQSDTAGGRGHAGHRNRPAEGGTLTLPHGYRPYSSVHRTPPATQTVQEDVSCRPPATSAGLRPATLPGGMFLPGLAGPIAPFGSGTAFCTPTRTPSTPVDADGDRVPDAVHIE